MDSYALVAWIKPHAANRFVAAFVAAEFVGKRVPATRVFGSQQAAQHWVEQEAAALDVPVQWERSPPH